MSNFASIACSATSSLNTVLLERVVSQTVKLGFVIGADFQQKDGRKLCLAKKGGINQFGKIGLVIRDSYKQESHRCYYSKQFGTGNGDVFFIRGELGYSPSGTYDWVSYRLKDRNSTLFAQGNSDSLDDPLENVLVKPKKAPPEEKFLGRNVVLDGRRLGDERKEEISGSDELDEEDKVSSSFDLLELKREMENEERAALSSGNVEADGDLVGERVSGSKTEELEEFAGESGFRNRREVLRRSSLLAKQVISMQSALSMGFVSQLWVDTRSWVVLVVEVRPSLLSGEIERFLLKDVHQVGDVVLVPDESIIENDLRMIGLDTLVGYNVLTPDRQNVGKVRGYTFNINTGSVETLELDSFGISIIPSSLVSTYCLFVEDVLEVVSDMVILHEGAASRVQRLTKGFWDTQNNGISRNRREEYLGIKRSGVRTVRSQRSRRRFSGQNFPAEDREDKWELPMDY